jgi:guanine deaminase
LVLLNLRDPSFVPLNSAVRQLVYTEGGRGVETVIVDGEVVIEDRALKTVNEDDLLAQVLDVIPRFREDFAAIEKRVARLQPYLAEAHRHIWAADVGGNRLFTGR